VRICYRPGSRGRSQAQECDKRKPEPRKNTRLYDRNSKGLDSKAQKLICTKSRTTRSRVIILCSCVAKRMVAPEQREAYSSEHAITDFNSANAKRNTQSVSVGSRVYYLAGIGKCTNPLEPFCAALRWHQFVLHSRSPASCITCDSCGVITLPRTRL